MTQEKEAHKHTRIVENGTKAIIDLDALQALMKVEPPSDKKDSRIGITAS